MNKIIIVITSIVLLSFLHNYTSTAATTNDLDKLATIIQASKSNSEIHEWKVFARSDYSKNQQEVFNDLKRINQGFIWETNSEWVGTKQLSSSIEISIKIFPIQADRTMVVFQIKGTEWSNEQDKLMQEFILQQKFSKKTQFYTCLSGTTDGNMRKALYTLSEDWLADFQAISLEQSVEENFLTVSARSEYFEDTLSNQMNLQIAFRNDVQNGVTKFTIGTPIIMSEY